MSTDDDDDKYDVLQLVERGRRRCNGLARGVARGRVLRAQSCVWRLCMLCRRRSQPDTRRRHRAAGDAAILAAGITAKVRMRRQRSERPSLHKCCLHIEQQRLLERTVKV